MLAYLLACQLVSYAARRGYDAVIVCDVAHVALPTDDGHHRGSPRCRRVSWVPCRRVVDLHALVGAA